VGGAGGVIGAAALVIPAKAGTQADSARALLLRQTTFTVIPAKAGTHLAFAVAVIPAKAGTQAVTQSALRSAAQSKEGSPAKLPITCGARVTFLCSHKEK